MTLRPLQTGLALLLSLFSTAEAATVEFETEGFTQQVETSYAQKLTLEWPSILRLYAGLDGQSLWHRGDLLNARGRLLYARLLDAEADGLNPDDYHSRRLRQLEGESGEEARILRELLLSDGYLRLAVDLRQGYQAGHRLDAFWKAQAESFDPVVALQSALALGRFDQLLEGLSPQITGYERLRQALADYRRIERAGGWPRLEQGPSLRPGDRDPRVVVLRQRLLPLTYSEDTERYDELLQAAVKRFQTRHGLEPDGVVGRDTLEALNVPVARRIAQLRANLERWRWLPHQLEADHILVNTAGFRISMQTDQQQVFSSRTVNGRVSRQTPALISRVTHMVANPQWTLPRRIAIQDILPKQQADPEFLTSKKIRVLQWIDGELQELDPQLVDWSLLHKNNFPYVLRQDAGPGNSLGRVKFHLPNRQAIYLHDTPAVGLFKRSRRAFSSGCVRVEGADRLANLLISRAEPRQAERFNRAMETGETLWVPLAEPIPVYLTYFTTWVDASGEVHFRPDIYHRNSDLMLAFGSEKPPVTAQRSNGAEPTQL